MSFFKIVVLNLSNDSNIITLPVSLYLHLTL